jgi:hypothetical protein
MARLIEVSTTTPVERVRSLATGNVLQLSRTVRPDGVLVGYSVALASATGVSISFKRFKQEAPALAHFDRLFIQL